MAVQRGLVVPGARRRGGQHLHHCRNFPKNGQDGKRVRSRVHGSCPRRGCAVHVRLDGLADDRILSRRALRHAGGPGLVRINKTCKKAS